MPKDALNLLGLCARAGRLKSGLEGCEQAVKRQGAPLCLVDEGISPPSRKAMEDACRFAGARLFTLPQGSLGQAIGKPGRMAVAVTDPGFAARLIQLLEQRRNPASGGGEPGQRGGEPEPNLNRTSGGGEPGQQGGGPEPNLNRTSSGGEPGQGAADLSRT